MISPGEPLLYYTGLALCATVAVRACFGGASWVLERRAARRRADRDAEAFREELRAVAAAARARLATELAWPGLRSLQVSAVVDEAAATRSYYLTAPDGRPLPTFLPGQYLTLSLPVGGESRPVVRCYSLSDRPRPEYYRLTVKRQGPPDEKPDAPAGAASGFLHDRIDVGDTLACEAPRGVFFCDPSAPRPVVLIGAGVGVTPLMSILAGIRHAGVRQPTHAFLAFRDGEHHLFRDALDEIQRSENPNLRIRVAYSRPRDNDIEGADYHERGRLTFDLLRRELPSSNFDFYLCGPPRMMQALVPDLLAWGAPAEAIHFETFGPASVSTNAPASLEDRAVGSQVRFNDEDEAVVWDGAHKTLLELAEARGVPIASGCRAGNCGTCRIRVVEGAVATLKRPGTPMDAGECLACISLPDGPVLLEA